MKRSKQTRVSRKGHIIFFFVDSPWWSEKIDLKHDLGNTMLYHVNMIRLIPDSRLSPPTYRVARTWANLT